MPKVQTGRSHPVQSSLGHRRLNLPVSIPDPPDGAEPGYSREGRRTDERYGSVQSGD